MPYTIVNKEIIHQKDVMSIVGPLQQYNLDNGPDPNGKGMLLTVEDDEGKISGGLFGKLGYGWLFIEFLVVPAGARNTGLGTRLMTQAEDLAREHGCHGVWLSTLAFQARPFYEKLGYTVFGQLDDYPTGSPHFFMKKKLV